MAGYVYRGLNRRGALTAVERAVLLGLSKDRSDEQIAIELGLSLTGARSAVTRARRKLSARTRAGAVATAIRIGAIK